MSNILANPKIFKNCLGIVESEEGIIPLRFTEKQLKQYTEVEAFRLRSYCPSGICIDVNTDTRFIKMKYKVKGFARNWLYFDVFVNDILTASIGSDKIESNNGEFYYELPAEVNGMNRITIYLPHIAEIIICDMEFSKGACVEPTQEYSKDLLCLGDSITQGMVAIKPSASYAVLLSRFFKMNLLNQGVGGYYFNEKSLDRNLPYKPDIVTIAYGTNDWGRFSNFNDFYEACSSYIDKVVEMYDDSKIYVITPLWRSDIAEMRSAGSFFDVSEGIKKICIKYSQITIVDGMELIPHSTDYFGDGLHPTQEGFLHMAMNLVKRVSLDI